MNGPISGDESSTPDPGTPLPTPVNIERDESNVFYGHWPLHRVYLIRRYSLFSCRDIIDQQSALILYPAE